MKKTIQSCSNFKFKTLGVLAAFALGGLIAAAPALAQSTAGSEFRQEITARPLQVRIVDDSGDYADFTSPYVAMSSAQYSFLCQTSTGTFGTATQQIYVENPGDAPNGWSLTLAASNVADLWTSASNPGDTFDFNDPADSGCTSGQMTVNPSVASLNTGACSACDTTDITIGSEASFDSEAGTPVNSITLLNASAGSSDIGDWIFNGTTISQTIPGETPVNNDYAINMVLTITAS